MVFIEINAEAYSRSDMAFTLREIATAIDDGYSHGITSGGTTWSVSGSDIDEDVQEDNDE